jgi:hypothetical protein
MYWYHPNALLEQLPLWAIALAMFGAMWLAAFVAMRLRLARDRAEAARHQKHPSETLEGYIVSAVLGLLALLLGFTFSLALDRFDTRRELVRVEANAIDTAYLRAQLLTEPHRTRATKLLLRYLDNRIAWATASPGEEQQKLQVINDKLIVDLWAAAAAAFETIKQLDWSSAYLESLNRVTELDLQRKAARAAGVPLEVFVVLIVYMITSAYVLGYVLRGPVGRFAGTFLLALFTVALVLIIDINRPTGRSNIENQQPMEILRRQLAAQPPSAFDRWRVPSGSQSDTLP